MVQTQDLRSSIQMGRYSEEEYFLGKAKHRSNIYIYIKAEASMRCCHVRKKAYLKKWHV